jgi:hypothetical protein
MSARTLFDKIWDQHVIADLETLDGVLRDIRGGAEGRKGVRHDFLRHPCEMNLRAA